MEKRSFVYYIVSVVISLALAGIDQFTKYLAVEYVKPVNSISLLKSGDTEWLCLTYCENTGMSFSMLEGQTLLLILLPVLLIAAIEWYIFSGRAKRLDVMIAAAVIAGGGFGNLIDRAFQGYVVDFIDVRIINFAIFNFADICAVCGGIYFCIVLIFEEHKEDKKKKNVKNDNVQDTGESGVHSEEQGGEQSDENA
ncbi:MAG: signal peptidase II [Ruminiclostridium sp.]|nr:signal peptidase II [Ruminiclostridium sp.]